jgi:enoyl-CoA hydratase/carnithine racemase
LSSSVVRVERDGSIGTVTLSRPERRNAISIAMLEELTTAFGELGSDPDVRVVVLAGEGEHFCAGADFSDLTMMTPEGFDYGRSFEHAIESMAACSAPVVAKVQGAALGAGCQIVGGADLAVAAEDARFGIPAARLGLVINFENVQRLVLSVGVKRAGEILFTGRELSGLEAAEWGMVNEAVSPRGLDARVRELCETIAAGAPLTTRAFKRGIRDVVDHLSLRRDRDAESMARFDALANEAYGSADLAEGVRAFRERRPPRFEGR